MIQGYAHQISCFWTYRYISRITTRSPSRRTTRLSSTRRHRTSFTRPPARVSSMRRVLSPLQRRRGPMVLIKAVDGRRRSIKRRGGQSRPRRRAASWCDRVFDCLSFNPVVQNRHPRCPPSRTQAQTQECIPRYHHLSTLALVSLLRQIATPRHTAHSETHTSLFHAPSTSLAFVMRPHDPCPAASGRVASQASAAAARP